MLSLRQARQAHDRLAPRSITVVRLLPIIVLSATLALVAPLAGAEADAGVDGSSDQVSVAGASNGEEPQLAAAEQALANGDVDRAESILSGIRRNRLPRGEARTRFDAVRRGVRSARRSSASSSTPMRERPTPRQSGTPPPASMGSDPHRDEGTWCAGSVCALLILFGIGATLSPARRCSVCGITIGRRRVAYIWKIDGKRRVMCSNCNRRAESRKSEAAWS